MAEAVLSAALSVPATLRAGAATRVVYLQGVGSGWGRGVGKGGGGGLARDSIHDMDHSSSVMKGIVVTDQKGTTVVFINSCTKVFQ